MPEPVLRVFVGYEHRQAIAYHVLAHSILTRATCPVAVCPLERTQLADVYRRERAPGESTDFSLLRFLVPYLCGYTGWAIYMDCDMLVRTDLAALWQEIERQPDMAVLVCKHDITQSHYRTKNWSSFMAMNTARCRALTPEYVGHATKFDLQKFHWMDHAAIGALPLDWNWLVGVYQPNDAARCLHWTLGGPWFAEYRDIDHADLWNAEYRTLTACPSVAIGVA